MSSCYLVGDMNINLLGTSAIEIKYIDYLNLNGCYQGIKYPTRVTPTSETFLDNIVHHDCLTNLVFGVINQ